MEPIEISAKKVDDALREGLRILGTTLDKVEYKVLSAGGLFKKAKISIALLEDASEKPAKQEAKKTESPKKSEAQPVSLPQQKEKPRHTQARETTDESPRAKDYSQNKPKSQSKPKEPTQETKQQPAKSRDGAGKNRERSPHGSQKQHADRPPRSNSDTEPRENDVKKRARAEEIREEDVKRATDFTTELIRLMGIEAEIRSSIVDGDLVIELVTEKATLIGYRGEILDAIEYLVSIRANKDNEEFINIIVDSCGYRKKREEMLIGMAEKAANRCIKTNRKVIMEPMNRSSRKIVHSTLSKFNNITSKSEGNEPNRHIVIYFKRGRNN